MRGDNPLTVTGFKLTLDVPVNGVVSSAFVGDPVVVQPCSAPPLVADDVP